MTPDRLLAEGRRLARPCLYLKENGPGEPCAVWYGSSGGETRRAGQRAWLTFDASVLASLASLESVPGPDGAHAFGPLEGYVTVFSDEQRAEGGNIQIDQAWPQQRGTPLHAIPMKPLPPLEVVFLYGSPAVAEWLQDNRWPRDKRYGSGFSDALIADAYLQQWLREQAMYTDPAVAAVIGGWHMPRGDTDWYSLASERLLVQTLRDAEPWVEAWQLRSGGLNVIRRVT